MTRKAAVTGSGPTAAVAIEQNFPAGMRLINDKVACRLLPPGDRFWVWLTSVAWLRDLIIAINEKFSPGLWAIFPCRKRYIDDKVAQAVAEGILTVVNLGAGFDSLAFRLPVPETLQLWELDQPANIDAKRARLKKIPAKPPARLTLVPIDFDREDLSAVLTSHGYPGSSKTFFILEAVTQYLSGTGIKTTFDFLAKAQPGSRLVFTYVPKGFMEGRELYGQEFLYKKMVIKEKSWIFGIEPEGLSDFLSGYGWRVVEHLGYDELFLRYVKPTGREFAPVEIERLVFAEKL